MGFSNYAHVTLLIFAVLTLNIILHFTNMYVEIVRLKSKLTHYKYQDHFFIFKKPDSVTNCHLLMWKSISE